MDHHLISREPSEDTQRRWLEARRRMRLKIDAILKEGGDLQPAPSLAAPRPGEWADRMLDTIIKEEFLALLPEDWTVWREDDNSARFVVRAGLTRAAAKALADELQLRGHKQFYWSEPTARR